MSYAPGALSRPTKAMPDEGREFVDQVALGILIVDDVEPNGLALSVLQLRDGFGEASTPPMRVAMASA